MDTYTMEVFAEARRQAPLAEAERRPLVRSLAPEPVRGRARVAWSGLALPRRLRLLPSRRDGVTARPPTASARHATIPNQSHVPTIGWPRWVVGGSWFTQSGSLSAARRRRSRT